ncbi:hypothetical protein [Anaerosphaera multitolerans]|uniref:Uncharacterized protein n=1 Tax=Anaerosphaera multitolerans TaxID=2487351 RepID=A0A437S7B0_9FIRM|nr:hypothetical protein [Anaerosphaera multitolerans]RVU54874.1 hypothetical protein EF514_04620 [Anaerosphaera multitolerans]
MNKKSLVVFIAILILTTPLFTYASDTKNSLNESNDYIRVTSSKDLAIPLKDSPYYYDDEILGVSIIKKNGSNYIKISDLPKISSLSVDYKPMWMKCSPSEPGPSWPKNIKACAAPGAIITNNSNIVIQTDEYRNTKYVNVGYMLEKYTDTSYDYYFVNEGGDLYSGEDYYQYYFYYKSNDEITKKKLDIYSKDYALYMEISDFKEIIYPYLLEIFSQE